MFNADNYLEKVLGKIRISEHKVNWANKWIKIIKEGLEGHERRKIRKIFTTGSYSRNTAIRPLNNIDVFVVLNEKEYKKNYVELIKSFIPKIQSIITKNHPKDRKNKFSVAPMDHGIIIKNPKKKPIFKMDLVLAFSHNVFKNFYMIPDGWDGWTETSKSEHEENLKISNEETNGLTNKYIKLLKKWNYRKNKPLNSFHLEVMILENIPMDTTSLSKGIITLFKSLSGDVIREKPHPSGKGKPIDELTPKKRTRIRSLFDDSFEKARSNNWSNIFGYMFKI